MKRMNEYPSYQKQPVRRYELYARALQIVLILLMLLTLASPVSAQSDPGGDAASGLKTAIDMFKKLAEIFVQIAFTLMFIVFAVGSVKNGLGANIAHQFGMAHRLSQDMLNLVGGVVIFALGLLTLTFVNYIMAQVSSLYQTNIVIPIPTITIK